MLYNLKNNKYIEKIKKKMKMNIKKIRMLYKIDIKKKNKKNKNDEKI